MNNIDFSDERYLVIEDPQKNLDKTYNDLMERLPERYSGLKPLSKVDFVKAISKILELGEGTERWIDFQVANIGKKCVWDTETGNMFTIK